MEIESTMTELHKELMEEIKAKGGVVENVEAFLRDYFAKVGRGMPIEVLLLQAEFNQTLQDLRKLQDKIGADVARWIDTKAQGDLFNDIPMRVPKLVLVDGISKPYWKTSLREMESYIAYVVELREQSAEAAKRIANLKHQHTELAIHDLAAVRQAVAVCERNGIDPNTIRFEQR